MTLTAGPRRHNHDEELWFEVGHNGIFCGLRRRQSHGDRAIIASPNDTLKSVVLRLADLHGFTIADDGDAISYEDDMDCDAGGGTTLQVVVDAERAAGRTDPEIMIPLTVTRVQ